MIISNSNFNQLLIWWHGDLSHEVLNPNFLINSTLHLSRWGWLESISMAFLYVVIHSTIKECVITYTAETPFFYGLKSIRMAFLYVVIQSATIVHCMTTYAEMPFLCFQPHPLVNCTNKRLGVQYGHKSSGRRNKSCRLPGIDQVPIIHAMSLSLFHGVKRRRYQSALLSFSRQRCHDDHNAGLPSNDWQVLQYLLITMFYIPI